MRRLTNRSLYTNPSNRNKRGCFLLSFLVVSTPSDDGLAPLICVVMISPRRAQRILRRMNRALEAHEEDSLLYGMEYFDSGGVEFLTLSGSTPQKIFDKIVKEDEEFLILRADEMKEVYETSTRVRVDVITQVVTSEQEVTWRAYVKHTDERLRPGNIERSVLENIGKGPTR